MAWGSKRCDARTDGQTDGRLDRQTDRQEHSHICQVVDKNICYSDSKMSNACMQDEIVSSKWILFSHNVIFFIILE